MRARPLPIVILGVSLTLTAFVTGSVHIATTARDDARFANASEAAVDRIVTRMRDYQTILIAGSGLFSAADEEEIDATRFRAFVEEFRPDERFPGVQGIGFTRRLLPDERDAWLQRVRRDHPRFRIWPDGAREEYHAITWLEPLNARNRAALGYDMHTDATRREAMDRARDTGEPAMSGRVVLVQEIDEDKQPGFLIYVPVYRGPTPKTVEERRERLVGFSYSPFRARDLFDRTFGSEQAPRVSLAIYDGETLDESASLATAGGEPGARETIRRVTIAQRPWTIRIRSSRAFDAVSGRPLAALTLLLGLAFSSVLFGLSILQLRARASAERDAEKRKREADERATILRSEREARAEAELLNETMLASASELDEQKLLQLVIDQAVRASGAAFGAFFTNVLDESGESYLLYTLSGAPKEAFSKFPSPRNTAIFAPTFRGEAPVRLRDVTEDPRYGKNPPYNGLPQGHLPVRSYLAVPVRSARGGVIGGMFFGHPEPGVFTERHERLVVGLASQAAIGLDNSRLLREARDADRRKDEFLAMLAHELRNPLTPLVTALHMLRLRPESLPRSLEVMSRQTDRLVRLVDDLLDIARITRGRIRLQKEPFELGSLVHRVLETEKASADARSLRVEAVVPETAVMMMGDPARIEQAVHNLLSNAVKYTPAGGWIRVALTRDEKEARLSVKDSGIGIPRDFLPRVFDLFAQAERTLDRSEGGLGIGLTLVKTLVELHGGRVEAHSDGPGTGSEFVLRLPTEAVSEARESASPLRSPRSTRRILMVDDNVDNVAMLSELLTFHGHDVRTAYDGRAAIEIARSWKPDVAILDIGLPGLNGYDLAGEFRRDPALASTRLIALSGYAQEADRKAAFAAGFDTHLAKPVSPDSLIDALSAGAREH